MGTVAIPKPDFGNGPSVAKTTLGFGASEAPTGTIVLHIKVLSPDPVERLEVARRMELLCAEQRIGSKGLAVLITDDSVTVDLASTTPVTAKIAADVMRTLGMQR